MAKKNSFGQEKRALARLAVPNRKQEREHLATLEATYKDYLRMDDPKPFWVTLATCAANALPADMPLWLLLVGPPSCGKSATLASVYELPWVFPTGALTEAGLLASCGNDLSGCDGHGGLLRQIGEEEPGLICCKDYGSILSMDRSARTKLLAALREIYDGNWVRRLGARGGETLKWEGKAGLIGGVTPSIDRYQTVMASMGERFLMLRFSSTPEERKIQTEMALASIGQQPKALKRLQNLIPDFMHNLKIPRDYMPVLPSTIQKLLTDLSRLIATSRSAVDRDSRGKEIVRTPEPEHPARLARQLLLLFHGLILIGCRAREAWETIFEVGLCSMPVIRRRILQRLASAEIEQPTGAIAEHMQCSKKTVERELESLVFLKVLIVKRRGGSTGDLWRLSGWARKCCAKCEQGIKDIEDRLEQALVDPIQAYEECSTPPSSLATG